MILLLLVYLETLKQQSHRQREPETTRWLQQMHKIRQKALQTEGESRELRWGGVHSLHRLRSLRKVQTVEPNWVLSGGIWSFGTEKKALVKKKRVRVSQSRESRFTTQVMNHSDAVGLVLRLRRTAHSCVCPQGPPPLIGDGSSSPGSL